MIATLGPYQELKQWRSEISTKLKFSPSFLAFVCPWKHSLIPKSYWTVNFHHFSHCWLSIYIYNFVTNRRVWRLISKGNEYGGKVCQCWSKWLEISHLIIKLYGGSKTVPTIGQIDCGSHLSVQTITKKNVKFKIRAELLKEKKSTIMMCGVF